MKPSLFDIMEDDDRREDMMDERSSTIGKALKDLFNDLPTVPKPDSVKYLKLCHDTLMTFKDFMEEIAEPQIEDLEDELAEASHIDAQIHEGKCDD